MFAKFYRAPDGSEPVAAVLDGLPAEARFVLNNQIRRLNLLTDETRTYPTPIARRSRESSVSCVATTAQRSTGCFTVAQVRSLCCCTSSRNEPRRFRTRRRRSPATVGRTSSAVWMPNRGHRLGRSGTMRHGSKGRVIDHASQFCYVGNHYERVIQAARRGFAARRNRRRVSPPPTP